MIKDLKWEICSIWKLQEIWGNWVLSWEFFQRFLTFLRHRKGNDQIKAQKGQFQGHNNRLQMSVLTYFRKKLLCKHLWSHVLRTAAVRICDVFIRNIRFGKSKISDFDVSILIEKNIFKFQISKKNVLRMQIFHAL